MSSIDTRIVELRLNNKQFLDGIKQTLAALASLDKATKMAGATKGLSDLNAAAKSVDLTNIATQADKVNSKLGNINTKGVTDINAAANQVNMSNISSQADKASSRLSSISTKGLSMLSAAADKVNLSRIWQQADKTSAAVNDISTKGLTDLTAAANRVDLSHISSQADQASGRLTAMGAAGAVALGNLATQAMTAGMNLTKALTINPVMDGLREYETGLNSVQTIMANTQAAGTTLPQVNASLKDLNHYADQTIYNFSEMTRNMGTFTAAGVDLDTAQQSIKGIANLAALSGSNSVQASTAMYQLSQAISSGKVSLMDWNSVVNAGMGGSVFQRALAQTAVKMGKLDESAVSLKGKMKNVTIEGQSFRDSISAENGASWLTSDVLTTTLQQLAGGFTDAQLKAQGFNDAEIKAIQSQAKMATDAATKVKTFTQLLDTTKEAVGSGWADTWQIIFGDFEGAKALWTGVSKVVSDMVGKSAEARNKVLGDWAKLGGRADFLEGLKNAFNGLKSVIKPISEAFREIFPATTGKQLAEMSKNFREFTSHLKIGKETANNLKRTFAGVFSIFSTGWEIIKNVAKVFLGLFKTAGSGGGSFLKITAAIGDFLVSINKAVKEGEGFKKFFEVLGNILNVPIAAIKALGKAIANVFGKAFDTSPMDDLKSSVEPLSSIGDMISRAWDGAKKALSGVMDKLGPIGDMFGNIFGALEDGLAGGFDFSAVVKLLEAGLIGGIFMTVRKFFNNISDLSESFGDALDNITSPMASLTDTMDQMQNTLKAATLLQIAIAIGVLTASVVALSKIDSAGLTRALKALSVTFAELIVAMAIFQKIDIRSGMGQLILLSVALKILTSSVKDLAELDWEQLAKGLTGTSILLVGLAAAARMMPDGKKMISSSLGLLVMATAIKVLASAVKDLSELKWDELAKGLIGVGGLLGALALFTKFTAVDKGGLIKGAGILLLAAGMKVLASAVKDFGQMNWEDMAKGLLGVAGGLTVMALALKLIPPSSILSAAAILVVASSLSLIGDAVVKMGELDWETLGTGLTGLAGALTIIGAALLLIPPSTLLSAAAILVVAGAISLIGSALLQMSTMSWEEIAKGLVSLAGALGIIAIAMNAMVTALPGAAALLVVSAALAVLAPILISFGMMSWESIGAGLTMLAGALTIIGVAGLLLTPVIPGLLGLGAAIALIGAGAALAGLGLMSVGAGLGLIASAGAAAVPVFLSLVGGLINMIPRLASALGQAVITFLNVIRANVPVIIATFVALVSGILAAIRTLAPQIGATFTVIVQTILQVIRVNTPSIVATFVAVVRGFLAGVRALMPDIMATFSSLLQGVLGVVRNNMPAIMSTFTAILQGILGVIRNNTPSIISTFMNMLQQLLNAAVRAVPMIVNAGANIIIGFLNGMAQRIPGIVTAATNLIVSFLNAIGNNLPRIAQAGADLIIKFINSVADTIRNNSSQLGAAAGNLATAIIEGMVKGLSSGAGAVWESAKNVAKGALNAAKSWLGINSPSKEFAKVGAWSSEGMAIGLDKKSGMVGDAATNVAKVALDSTAKALDINSPSKKFQELGKYSAEGYAKGLEGSASEIKKATDTMKKNVSDALTASRTEMNRHRQALNKLWSANKKNWGKIAKETVAFTESYREVQKLKAVQKNLDSFGSKNTSLTNMANQIDALTPKIADAKKKLEEATKARDDFAKSTKDTYANIPDVSKDTKLPDYIKEMQKRIADVQIFKAQLEKLKSLGLNDDMYKELLSKGTDAIPFVTQLLDRGAVGVKEINELDSALVRSATALGNSASKALYQAGVDSAAGLVKGLENQKANLEKQMHKLADSMVAQIKKSLGIKSPSREFMAVGDWSILGLAKGLENAQPAISAANAVGDNAVSALKQSLSNVNRTVTDNLDSRPTIRPVLDLTDIKTGSDKIAGLIANEPLEVSAAYSQASTVLSQVSNAKSEEASNRKPNDDRPNVTFVQHNTSPQALSASEIYRQTNNLMSRIKEDVTNR